ncbi:unnamed protein product [Acanthocheilonema viteae]|uniref:Uncharacterized protein n=1 Tax=Acanthocheilonema viteae TaxID=6277 RepID=A0A498SCJ4_ACAVI|nr:unnamed protein product [Acanthocheilonema viteae]
MLLWMHNIGGSNSEKGAPCSPAHPSHQYTQTDRQTRTHMDGSWGHPSLRKGSTDRTQPVGCMSSPLPTTATVPPKEPIGSIGLSPPNGGTGNSLILCVRRGGTVRRGC